MYRVVLLVKKWTTKHNDPGVQICLVYSQTYETDSYWYHRALPNITDFKYIIIIIDAFIRFVEIFPKQEVTAIAAADALMASYVPVHVPLKIVTDFFHNLWTNVVNAESGINYQTPIPYSKEENGIFPPTQRFVWQKSFQKLVPSTLYVCVTEPFLNTSVKQPLGAFPNNLLLGNAFSTDPSLLS